MHALGNFAGCMDDQMHFLSFKHCVCILDLGLKFSPHVHQSSRMPHFSAMKSVHIIDTREKRERERDGCDLLAKSLCIVWDYPCCIIITKPTRAAELPDNHRAFSGRETDKPLQERKKTQEKNRSGLVTTSRILHKHACLLAPQNGILLITSIEQWLSTVCN